MDELIKVTINKNNEQLVSGRELYEFLEIATPYDDDQFQVVDGSVVIPLSVLSDIVRRCENGDLEVDEEMLFGLKEIVARMGE